MIAEFAARTTHPHIMTEENVMLISSRIGEIFIGRELSAGRMRRARVQTLNFATSECGESQASCVQCMNDKPQKQR